MSFLQTKLNFQVPQALQTTNILIDHWSLNETECEKLDLVPGYQLTPRWEWAPSTGRGPARNKSF